VKIVRLSETKINKVSSTCTAIEYPDGDKNIWGAVIQLKGRYPTRGWTVNHKCTELVYVIKGSGILNVNGIETAFNKGDQIAIGAGEKFYWIGEGNLFMPCAPAWYPAQHETID
jgi:mannose-6-phosphate isomerase-like protein (cupin superfamily)